MDHLVTLILIAAAISWLAGGFSLFGNLLELRRGTFWVALRWFGLGIVVASYLLRSDLPALQGATLPLVGSIVLLVGVARKKFRRNCEPSSNPGDSPTKPPGDAPVPAPLVPGPSLVSSNAKTLPEE